MRTEQSELDAADCLKAVGRRCAVAADAHWQPTGHAGVVTIPIARGVGPAGTRVALFRLAAGAALPTLAAWREAVVLEGELRLTAGVLDQLGYARSPASEAWTAGPSGCELFVRDGIPADLQQALTHAPFGAGTWLPGHGNLTVRPLHAVAGGSESTALVRWPQGERFVPHRHFGGEEIFVLSGTFRDEHGSYPARTWLLSGHQSAHQPFVDDPTVIFVKTGHLPPR
jgi:quercetin dioxygenase-like cupin family protein